ncbi:unnamed protein product [Echinostoma caproni]|uniref:PBPe domain-containing protein n=1 Tax=Echinostoma caproni TaxID=27848 RepID=A0A183A512_9TREM|nr:unnamed protein product [Echinostoma caproni]
MSDLSFNCFCVRPLSMGCIHVAFILLIFSLFTHPPHSTPHTRSFKPHRTATHGNHLCPYAILLQQPWNVKPPFRFATIPSGATEENIKINFPEMNAYMRKFNRSSVEEGLKALRSGELDAFIYDANVLDYWASKDEGCKLRIVGNLYAMTGYGIGFTRGNKWLEKVNSRILDYQKNGTHGTLIIPNSLVHHCLGTKPYKMGRLQEVILLKTRDLQLKSSLKPFVKSISS